MAVVLACRSYGKRFICIGLTSDEDLMAADLLQNHLPFVMEELDPEWKIHRINRTLTSPVKAVCLPRRNNLAWRRDWGELYAVLQRINARGAQIRAHRSRNKTVPEPSPWMTDLRIARERREKCLSRVMA